MHLDVRWIRKHAGSYFYIPISHLSVPAPLCQRLSPSLLRLLVLTDWASLVWIPFLLFFHSVLFLHLLHLFWSLIFSSVPFLDHVSFRRLDCKPFFTSLFFLHLHLSLHFPCFTSSVVWHAALPEPLPASCCFSVLSQFFLPSLSPFFSFCLLKSYICPPPTPHSHIFFHYFLTRLILLPFPPLLSVSPPAIPPLLFLLLYHSVSSDSCWRLTSSGHCSLDKFWLLLAVY